MKRKASTSHDEATIRELRDNLEFAAEYLRAALEDDDEPSVLLLHCAASRRREAALPRWRVWVESFRNRSPTPGKTTRFELSVT
ncbi:MAG: hypothetical protein WA718_21585 [Terriglobales bacterium]